MSSLDDFLQWFRFLTQLYQGGKQKQPAKIDEKDVSFASPTVASQMKAKSNSSTPSILPFEVSSSKPSLVLPLAQPSLVPPPAELALTRISVSLAAPGAEPSQQGINKGKDWYEYFSVVRLVLKAYFRNSASRCYDPESSRMF